jgi:starch-binding outer membrane protein, SusD/RagB family
MKRTLFRGRLAAAATLLAVAGTATLIGCSRVTEPLLDAPDPDLIVPAALQNADGAQGLYIGALSRLRQATASTGGGLQEPEWMFSGLLADEWSTSSTFVQNDEVDQRNIKLDNGSVRDVFRALARTRSAANQAIESLRLYRPTETVKIAEMYLARGFAEAQMAQDFCNGIPLSDVAPSDAPENFNFGTPLTVIQVFNRAIASYDSALAIVGTSTAAASVDIARATRIAKARALFGIDTANAPAAAALVTATLVPTTYSYDITFSTTGGTNAIWGQATSSRRYTVSDSIEGNARNLLVKNVIPFFSLKDPRVPVAYSVSTNGKDTTKSQDGFTFSRTTSIWGQLTTVSLVNGIDARLLEAEAQLVAGQYATMTATLNALRKARPKIGEITIDTASTVLPPLAVPASKTEAENTYFREKALWTFGRGQRLGDLRRLVRQYKRPITAVFPEGPHYRGGVYGPDTNMPVPKEEEKNNPNFSGCINRDP